MPRHFSMIRDFQIADFLTLANGFAGTGAILATLAYVVHRDDFYVKLAFSLLPVALVCDFLDGRVARLRHESSPLGQELDSLADLVSFGVAPAVLAFGLGMRGLWDALVLVYFVGCGISRLARYNATAASLSDGAGKVRYFEGTPIPTSGLLVILLLVAATQGALGESLWFGQIRIGGFTLHPLVLLFALSGSLMVSRIRFPKF